MRIKQTPGGSKPPSDAAKADTTSGNDKDQAKEPDARSGAGRVKAAVAAAAATGDKDALPKAAAADQKDTVAKSTVPPGQKSKDAAPAPADRADANAKAKAPFDRDEPILADSQAYRQRWDSIQIGFVDEPLYAVESAGRLVAEVLGELASSFATRRKELESQWRHDGEISTEELRVAFQGYRAFFNRLASA